MILGSCAVNNFSQCFCVSTVLDQLINEANFQKRCVMSNVFECFSSAMWSRSFPSRYSDQCLHLPRGQSQGVKTLCRTFDSSQTRSVPLYHSTPEARMTGSQLSRVIVSIPVTQSRSLIDISLILRWSVGLTTLRLLSTGVSY